VNADDCAPDWPAQISGELANSDHTPRAALRVLGLALRWAADALESESAAAPAAAFLAVAEADRALAAAPAFYDALQALVVNGEPAAQVTADLRRHAERGAELDAELSPLRARLSELLSAEDGLRAQLASRDEMTVRITELERIERLAAQLAGLRAQRDALAERTRLAEPEVTGAEAALDAAAGRLITLSQSALENLTDRTRELLAKAGEQDVEFSAQLIEHRQASDRLRAQAAAAETELAAAKAELAEAEARYGATRAEAESRRTALRRYQQANRAVADGLAAPHPQADSQPGKAADPVVRALRALDEVQRRLAEVDAMLAEALSLGGG
jgi:chromosome segregation ATPase